MSGMEVLVVVVFLLLGYWIMSAVLNWLSRRGPSPAEQSDGEWFRILGVPEDASKDEIVAAYKQKISQYHPDKVAQMGEEFKALAESKSTQINAAYQAGMKLRQ